MDKALREQQLRKLIEASPIPCILTDPEQGDNAIVAANAAFLALTGYAEQEVLGRNCRLLHGPLTEPGPRDMLRRKIAAGASAVVEITNHRRDGSAFRNAVMIAPCLDEAGKLLFFLGSQMEIDQGGLGVREESARRRIAELAPRQAEVLGLMARGMRHAQIAKALTISEKTVKMHRGALVAKLGCQTSAEAIRIAVEAGL
jgi:PAS domain S-box-containing protein